MVHDHLSSQNHPYAILRHTRHRYQPVRMALLLSMMEGVRVQTLLGIKTDAFPLSLKVMVKPQQLPALTRAGRRKPCRDTRSGQERAHELSAIFGQPLEHLLGFER